ncbi:MAG TPA: hypothetical protein DGT21_09210 [Armatimonadetes bacterium]|nr:hypothetical protein [Armatimonadota bacterium]
MTLRQRLLDVYRAQTPDVVPYALDLSHWFYHRHGLPWDLSTVFEEPDRQLVDYHRAHGVGFSIANLAPFFSVTYAEGVDADSSQEVRDGVPEITWRLCTPIGSIQRTRIWEESSYSWGIREWGVRTEADLRVLGYALGSRTFLPGWDSYTAWSEYVGDCGLVAIGTGYSAIGSLLSLWMGIEGATYAICDWPETVQMVVDQINESNLGLIDLLASSPAEVILMGDNFSSDIQPPHFIERWSADYYREATRRLHAAGKYVAVHLDGRLTGILKTFADIGIDCADAVTPTPMGDLTPAHCRDEAGVDLILSGGVSPDLWLPNAPLDSFKRAVLEWLELRHRSPRLIAGVGDQVPPHADEDRIKIMRDMVDEHGRY